MLKAKPIVNIDMDGVLVDYDNYIMNNTKPGSAWHLSEEDILIRRAYTRMMPTAFHREVLPWMVNTFQDEVEFGILSSTGGGALHGHAAVQKAEWLIRHIPVTILQKMSLTFCTASARKGMYCRSPVDVLIDDRAKCLDSWGMSGGIPVEFTEEIKDMKARIAAAVKTTKARGEYYYGTASLGYNKGSSR